MPRPARRILTCVLIGLLLNAAVTAVCWLAQPTYKLRDTDSISYGDSFVHQNITLYLLHSVDWTMQMATTDNPETVVTQYLWRPQPSDKPIVTCHELKAYGFPFRALRFQAALQGRSNQLDWKNPNLNHTLPPWRRGLPTGLQGHHHRRFPTEPLPGFLYNTLIYAAIPALVMTASHLRAHRRRRQSRCPACGYPVAGLPTCPECGQAVATPTPGHAHDESSNRGVPSPP